MLAALALGPVLCAAVPAAAAVIAEGFGYLIFE
jgi:hypothetical protein